MSAHNVLPLLQGTETEYRYSEGNSHKMHKVGLRNNLRSAPVTMQLLLTSTKDKMLVSYGNPLMHPLVQILVSMGP